MTNGKNLSLDRRIPLALMFTIMLQLGGVVWWASRSEAQDRFRDMRMDSLEARRIMDSDRAVHILERLSRLEARSESQLEILQRLDAQLSRRK